MMALRWLACVTAVLVLVVSDSAQPDGQNEAAAADPGLQSCEAFSNYHGVPGLPGSNGPHGADGPMGGKGDPGDSAVPVRGRTGDAGDPGYRGRPGPKGEPGAQGPMGSQGPLGLKGKQSHRTEKQMSFFSYKRSSSQPPRREQPITFNREVLQDLDESLRGDSLTYGVFQCKIKGVYFFTYHVSAKDLVCLKLMKGAEPVLSMCDSSSSHLVTSGSVVLDLVVGDRVSLQPTQHNRMVSNQWSDNTFTGLLLFPTA